MRGVSCSSFIGPGISALRDLAPADAEHRQHRHHQHDDAHAAQPLQLGAPDVERRRQVVEPGEERRAGRRQRGHRFEVGVGEREPEARTSSGTQAKSAPPTHTRVMKRMPSRSCSSRALAAGGEPHGEARGEVERHRPGEYQPSCRRAARARSRAAARCDRLIAIAMRPSTGRWRGASHGRRRGATGSRRRPGTASRPWARCACSRRTRSRGRRAR